MANSDVVIIGAGIVGAATAYFCARSGLGVTVLDRGDAAGGTSSHGEGNVLVSDKELGPELALALYSNGVWSGELAEYGALWELRAKGGLITTSTPAGMTALAALAEHQRGLGITVELVPDAAGLQELEPLLNPALAGGAYYPQDAQLQPILAARHLLRLAREHGATVRTHEPVTGLARSGKRVTGVRTARASLSAAAVVNCAGPWSGAVATLAGVELPVRPRRGYVLVTEPVGQLVHHKVYGADYVANVGSSDAGLQTSPVVESTDSGTLLIGSSRERVGFDQTLSPRALGAMAQEAAALFPFLNSVNVMRTYWGFRPYSPDHLPVIGPDPRAPGLWHASGHEGAGIGLAAGTGKLLAQALSGQTPDLDLTPFAPTRFEESAA